MSTDVPTNVLPNMTEGFQKREADDRKVCRLCASLFAHHEATGLNFVKRRLPVPWAATMRVWLEEEASAWRGEEMKKLTEGTTKHTCYFFWQAIICEKCRKTDKLSPSRKPAPVKQIRSHKPKIIRWDRKWKQIGTWKWACETVRGDKYIWGW